MADVDSVPFEVAEAAGAAAVLEAVRRPGARRWLDAVVVFQWLWVQPADWPAETTAEIVLAIFSWVPPAEIRKFVDSVMFRCNAVHRHRRRGAFVGALGCVVDGVLPWLVALCRASYKTLRECRGLALFRGSRKLAERLHVVSEAREILRGNPAEYLERLDALAEKHSIPDVKGWMHPPYVPKLESVLYEARRLVLYYRANPLRRPKAIRGLRRLMTCILDANARAFGHSDIVWESIRLGLEMGWGEFRRAWVAAAVRAGLSAGAARGFVG